VLFRSCVSLIIIEKEKTRVICLFKKQVTIKKESRRSKNVVNV